MYPRFIVLLDLNMNSINFVNTETSEAHGSQTFGTPSSIIRLKLNPYAYPLRLLAYRQVENR